MARKKKKKQKPVHEALPQLMRIYRHLWPWMRKQNGGIIKGFAFMFLVVVFRLLEPWPLKFIFDTVIPTKKAEAEPGFLDTLNPMFAQFYSRIQFMQVSMNVLKAVREHFYRHIQKLSLSFHDKARGGDLIVRVSRDVSMMRDMTATAILPMLADSIILVGMLSIMFCLEWRLTLLALSIAPFFWVTTVRISRKIHIAARKQRARKGELAATASESISAISAVSAYLAKLRPQKRLPAGEIEVLDAPQRSR